MRSLRMMVVALVAAIMLMTNATFAQSVRVRQTAREMFARRLTQQPRASVLGSPRVSECGIERASIQPRHGPPSTPEVNRPHHVSKSFRIADESNLAFVRPGRIVQPMIAEFGPSAAQAVAVLNPRQARRLAILADSRELARIGRSRELLDVLERYGDRAMDFVWRHKGALAFAAVMAAFLANPEPFLDGVKDVSSLVAQTVVKPLAEVPGHVAIVAARSLNWTVVVLAVLAVISLWYRTRSHVVRGGRPKAP